MKYNNQKRILRTIIFLPVLLCMACQQTPKDWHWETLIVENEPVARHEAGFVAYKDLLYLLGGRRIQTTSVFDIKTNSWSQKSPPPIEMHHFQPVVFENAIYIIGAMTGSWPHETPLDRVLIYYPEKDTFEFGDTIPEDRRRGGSGAVVYNEKIYIIGGITNGHMNGYQPWFDVYDPKTGEWQVLEDAPTARDHFNAAINQGKLYAFAGRNTSRATEEDMALTIEHGDIYDFSTQQWEKVTNNLAIPTQRAGNFAFACNDAIVVGGGESAAQVKAHDEVEAFTITTGLWSKWPALNEGRHGTGSAVVGNYVYVASGCGNRGGEPELVTIERLELPNGNAEPITDSADKTPVYHKSHTVEVDFKGPETSETDSINPFLDYKLMVTFKNGTTKKQVRGFYATDGNAAQTSAQSGAIWKVRFTPYELGKWTYEASLRKGGNIALNNDASAGESVAVENSKGQFYVTTSDKEMPDFRAQGLLTLKNSYFYFGHTDEYWLKVGANSPENLLAYIDFDDTYRIEVESREGEATPPKQLHSYAPHKRDWKVGDPTWKNEKGKSLIGALNYLASKGMNSVYFLTMNIGGDGKDVWPYLNPNDFTRFDVSKLEQWNVLFDHMQQKGILLHIVLQETENETLFDNGDTGPIRKLYLQELIARFGHHPALVWNLGEENGPASWTPIAQNDAQRKAMVTYIKENDPYQHPVLLHTHSHDPPKTNVLDSIMGFRPLDGLSFQQDIRENVAAEIAKWRRKSKEQGNEWIITMDEIGIWHTGAQTDEQDPEHPTLVRHALWGSLMSGAAGVEWYFGYHTEFHDLNSEDWRLRNRLWELTDHAHTFFKEHLPYWEMQPDHNLATDKEAFCFQKPGEIYAIYLPGEAIPILDLHNQNGNYSVQWFDPWKGGELKEGSVSQINGGASADLGTPPYENQKDWVVLVKKNKN